MKTIAEFDIKNYNSDWKTFFREAVRVIIVDNGRIAMVKSKRGYYKFPGGGKRAFESDTQTAIRETLEETGLSVIESSVCEFGAILEVRKSNRHANEIFRQMSYYYTASVDETVLPQKLDGYEADEGYSLEWVDIKKARDINIEYAKNKRCAFLWREIFVLERIIDPDKDE